MSDWIDDDSLSSADRLARFHSLIPADVATQRVRITSSCWPRCGATGTQGLQRVVILNSGPSWPTA